MRVRSGYPFSQDPVPGRAMYEWFKAQARDLVKVLNGNVGFGDGVDVDNMLGKWVTITTTQNPNLDDVIFHGTGVIPIGYLVIKQNKPGSFYLGSLPWTVDNICLRTDGSSVTATIFILLPSVQPA